MGHRKWSTIKRQRVRVTYRATWEPDGESLLIRVPELPGGVTQAGDLSQVEPMARDLIATIEDIAPDSFDLTIDHAP